MCDPPSFLTVKQQTNKQNNLKLFHAPNKMKTFKTKGELWLNLCVSWIGMKETAAHQFHLPHLSCTLFPTTTFRFIVSSRLVKFPTTKSIFSFFLSSLLFLDQTPLGRNPSTGKGAHEHGAMNSSLFVLYSRTVKGFSLLIERIIHEVALQFSRKV